MAYTKVTGALVGSISDLDLTNVGDIELDSITGDGDTNTSITFSGSDVITIATGGSGRLTIGDGAMSPVTDNQIDLGTSSLEFKDAFFDGTVTSDAFAGPLTGAVTGNADTATEATNITAAANNSTDETVYLTFVDGATGTQGIETDTGLTYNPSTGVLTATQFTGNVTGNVTGNASGTAATVTTAAQPAITSVGALTSLTTSGNIGLGTPTDTWHSGYDAIQGQNFSLVNDVTAGASKAVTLAYNAYIDSGNEWTYINADEASYIQQYNGLISFATAAAGSADATITFGTKMTILNDGKVGINDTSPSYTLDIDGDINFTGSLREDGTALNTASLYSYDIDFLVIAGGGQGGDQHGGGGGAGGYRNSYSSETSGRGSSSETAFTTATGVTYTCTVGAGATTSNPGSGQDGADGSDSSISGSGLTTITCTGGGGGGGHVGGGGTGENGGCGGGSGLTGAGGDGVAAQGYDGGDNPGSGYASWPNVGGGGGGAGAAGGAGNANSNGDQNGWGGTGLASSITGSSVVRGGGGGGGSHSPHTPASGGNNLGAAGGGGQGGLGNSSSTNATNGVDGKGGGGGGSNGAAQPCGGGGDGIVILRMPTTNYTGTITGSPTVTTSGSDTILSFTGTGTYTS